MLNYTLSFILLVFFSTGSICAYADAMEQTDKNDIFACFFPSNNSMSPLCNKQDLDEVYEAQKEDFLGKILFETNPEQDESIEDEVVLSQALEHEEIDIQNSRRRRPRLPDWRRHPRYRPPLPFPYPYPYPNNPHLAYGHVCRNGYYNCWLPQPAVIGTPCSCSGPYGWFYGFVSNY